MPRDCFSENLLPAKHLYVQKQKSLSDIYLNKSVKGVDDLQAAKKKSLFSKVQYEKQNEILKKKSQFY